jgi:hypothetical protein
MGTDLVSDNQSDAKKGNTDRRVGMDSRDPKQTSFVAPEPQLSYGSDTL